MHVIVHKDHRESSWNSVEAFSDDFRTINLVWDLNPGSVRTGLLYKVLSIALLESSCSRYCTNEYGHGDLRLVQLLGRENC